MLPFIVIALYLALAVSASPGCKVTPYDADWPSHEDWAALNRSIDHQLLSTVPVASSCWSGNPFGSTVPCNTVNSTWADASWHAQLPESIDYPVYANNSCLPPSASGYVAERGCTTGGMPQYVVNATNEAQIATAMKWAAARNIRIVVKGTGHDLNGRSSGAFALSIWTHNLHKLERHPSWQNPATNVSQDVYVVGSGQTWGNVLTKALEQGRVVTTGQDPSVGLGGYIQGGGHGPLSRTYGLASSHVLQMRVVTTKGEVLVANEAENQDLFWALRGGGPGLYGVVTEYVIRHHPAPRNVVLGDVLIAPKDGNNHSAELSWDAAVTHLSALPDLMDAGLAGACMIATGNTAKSFASLHESTAGVVVKQVFWAFNSTPAAMEALVNPVLANITKAARGNSSLSITFTATDSGNYSSFYSAISGSEVAGGESLVSSRLLGRAELIDTPHQKQKEYLKIAMRSQDTEGGTYATVGLQGGPGVRNTPEKAWGALLPAWRPAYLHFITNGATVNSVAAGSPKLALEKAARWNEAKEQMWREWSPKSGAYMNEANSYDSNFKQDFYGSNYDRLVQIKKKHDPSYSLFVLSGVGSDEWDYDLDTGKLCRRN
ncbi:putative isoamyl alcohol oxidase [Aspergillus homomorphus CBS 101889]|uniref:FAD-binding domain-containing protein n=1 Tax=Aspergillus homomorphus (strain CBS 101889) TaxID=1450537 RepID=A0A395HPT5_ASPHC|nr:FAD-binding domain-containing protein [Aspergillus homomorphus CBS 101889]RAL08264.1 FAD-binding domain-containing protein [Aspergillus homomorphus CBS 101889]